VPIRFLLEPDHVFSPDDLKNLVVAFEDTLRALNLPDRNDPLSIRVASCPLARPSFEIFTPCIRRNSARETTFRSLAALLPSFTRTR
jgi:hypothetical protein